MTIQEAFKVLQPQGDTLDELKSAYRIKAKKYHPDINPDGLELMKVINAAFELLQKTLGKWSTRSYCNDGTPSIDEVLQEFFNKIRHCRGIVAEVCGSWLWVTGDTKPYKDLFKSLGMKFSGKKIAWYWHPEGYRKRSKQEFTLDEVRNMWGSTPLETEELTGIRA